MKGPTLVVLGPFGTRWLFKIIVASALFAWASETALGVIEPSDRIAYPLLAVAFTALALLVWRWPQQLFLWQRIGVTLVGLYFALSMLVFTMRPDPGPGPYTLASFGPWSMGGTLLLFTTWRARDALLQLDEAHSSLIAQLFWIGFARIEIAYERRVRKYGVSGWTFLKKAAYLLDSVFSVTAIPITLLMLIGFAGTAGFLLLGFMLMAARLMNWVAVPGYTAIMVTILFSASLILLGLGFAALLGFAPVMAPWLMRNHELSGRLFGVAGLAVHQATDRFPGDRVERLLDPENKFTHEDLRQVSLDEHWAKLGDNLPGILQNDLPRLGGSWLAAFFLVGLLVPFRNPGLGRLRIFVLLSLGALTVMQAVARTHLATLAPDVNSENLLVVLAPLVIIFGTGLFVLLLDQLELPPFGARGTVIGFFLLVACAPMLFTLGGTPRSPLVYPPYHPQVIQERAGWLGERELMMSDMPWAVAWYGRRDCVWLPSNVGEGFLAVHRVRPVAALYLTALTLDQKLVSDLLQGDDPAWGEFAANAVVKREIPEGFPLKFAFAEGFPYQLFLADRERWKPAAK